MKRTMLFTQDDVKRIDRADAKNIRAGGDQFWIRHIRPWIGLGREVDEILRTGDDDIVVIIKDLDLSVYAWRPAVPRIRNVLDELLAEKRIREDFFDENTIDHICAYLAETGDPCKIYGKKLREKIERGIEEGAW
jgi:hypothetical protein